MMQSRNKETILPNLSPFKLFWHLNFNLLFSKGAESIQKLKEIFSDWNKIFNDTLKAIQFLNKEIEKMNGQSSDEKRNIQFNFAWKKFTNDLKICIKHFSMLSNELHATNPSEKAIAELLHTIVVDLPELIISFDKLNIHNQIKKALPNFNGIKQSINTAFSNIINKTLPKEFKKHLEEYFYPDNQISPRHFRELSNTEKMIKLLLAQEVNHGLQALYLLMDEYSILFSANIDYFLDKPFDFIDEKSFLAKKSVRFVYEHFSQTYITNLTNAGYIIEDEIYPYPSAITKNREHLLFKINQKIINTSYLYSLLKGQFFQKVLNESKHFSTEKKEEIDLLNKLLKELKVWKSQESSLPTITKELPLVIHNLSSKTQSLFKKISQDYQLIENSPEKQKLNRLNATKKQIKKSLGIENTEEKYPHSKESKKHDSKHHAITTLTTTDNKLITIRALTTLDNKHQPVAKLQLIDRKYHPFTKSEKKESLFDIIQHYYTSIEKIQLQFKNIISEFTESKSNDSVQTTIKEYEEHIKFALDPYIYSTLFNEASIATNEASAESSDMKKPPQSLQTYTTWVEEMATSFLTLKKSLSLFNSIYYDKPDLKSPKRLSEELKKPIDIAVKLSDEFAKLAIAIHKLKKNAFIQQFTSLSAIKSFLTETFKPLDHYSLGPTIRLTKQHLSDINSLSAFLSYIKELYSHLEKNNPQDLKEKYAVFELIKTIQTALNPDEIDEETIRFYERKFSLFMQFKPEELEAGNKRNGFKLHDFIYGINLVFFLIKMSQHIDIPLAIDSLHSISHDLAFKLTQHFNYLARDIFLIIDKIEIQFYLKEGIINELCNINEISLKSIGKSFNELIEKNGYAFKKEERFPYKEAITNQRKLMLQAAQPGIEKTFQENRLKQSPINLTITTPLTPPLEKKEININHYFLSKKPQKKITPKQTTMKTLLRDIRERPIDAAQFLLSLDYKTNIDSNVLYKINSYHYHKNLLNAFMEILNFHDENNRDNLITDIIGKKNLLSRIFYTPIDVYTISALARPLMIKKTVLSIDSIIEKYPVSLKLHYDSVFPQSKKL